MLQTLPRFNRHLASFLFIQSFIWILIPSVSNASQLSCLELFTSASPLQQDLIEAQNMLDSFSQSLSRSEILTRYNASRAQHSPQQFNSGDLEQSFLRETAQFLEVIRSERLIEFQQKSLQAEARYRTQDPEILFEDLSESNLVFWLDRFNLDFFSTLPTEVQSEILAAKNNFKFYFEHNTVSKKRSSILSTSILSSRSLQTIGLDIGLNAGPFNREALQTDNNVYFFVKAMDATMTNPPLEASEYGEISLLLENSYAQQAGWVSSFVMYPRQLLDIVETLDPDLFKRFYDHLSDDIKWSYSNGYVPMELWNRVFTAENREQWLPLLRVYAKTDMLLPHFEIFAAHMTMFTLAELWQKGNINMYNHFINLSKHVPNLFLRQVFIRAGWSDGAELKIPVAVPARYIFTQQNTGLFSESPRIGSKSPSSSYLFGQMPF